MDTLLQVVICFAGGLWIGLVVARILDVRKIRELEVIWGESGDLIRADVARFIGDTLCGKARRPKPPCPPHERVTREIES